MSKDILRSKDFEHILTLITEARNRVYSKANSELVLLYFNVGKVVSDRVATGNWSENTVQQLSDFIQSKIPNLSGFNRRGLYRMKQFYEVYSDNKFETTAMTQLQNIDNKGIKIVSTVPTQLRKSKKVNPKVSAVPTLLYDKTIFQQKFIDNVLTQIT